MWAACVRAAWLAAWHLWGVISRPPGTGPWSIMQFHKCARLCVCVCVCVCVYKSLALQ